MRLSIRGWAQINDSGSIKGQYRNPKLTKESVDAIDYTSLETVEIAKKFIFSLQMHQACL
ncbi:MAG: hypothetical protein R2942_00100 [Ignavibacteria bacterium]